MYLRSVAREEVATVTDVLFEFYSANGLPGEGMGYFHRRIGTELIIKHLKEDPRTTQLMRTTYKSPRSRKGDTGRDEDSTG